KARNRVYRDGDHLSRVILPVVPAAERKPPRFLPPPQLQQYVRARSEPPRQQVLHDQITGTATVLNRTSGSLVLPDNRGEVTRESRFRCTASSKDPARASIVGTH